MAKRKKRKKPADADHRRSTQKTDDNSLKISVHPRSSASQINVDRDYQPAVNEIVRILTHIAARHHRRVDRVFGDWLHMVDDALDMLPVHAASVVRTGHLAEDPPGVKARFAQFSERYPHLDAEHNFARAMTVLLESAQIGYCDVVGTVYMAVNAENKYAGQYFTPWPVAHMMAMLIVGDAPQAVITRLMDAADAAANDPAAPAGLKAARLMGRLAALRDNLALHQTDFPDDQDFPAWLAEYWPLIAPHYTPVTIHDPALGSGVMMLAAASLFPRWMLYLGLVQFYGSDIDEICIRMAHINAKLYGLNGYGGRMLAALHTPQLTQGAENEQNAQLTVIAAPGA